MGWQSAMACEIEVDFTYYAPNQYGVWSFEAFNAYQDGSPPFWEADGQSDSDVFVDIDPSYESSSYNTDEPRGALFDVTLGPDIYFGGSVGGSLSGISDGCYSSLPSGPEIAVSAAGGSIDIYNKYQDTVADPDWVNYYNAAIAAGTIGSCGWSANESMNFNGDSYQTISLGQSLNGASTTTSRDSASHTASWN